MKFTKTKCFISLAVILGLLAVVMIFLPQVVIKGVDISNVEHTVNITWPTFFGGEVNFDDGFRMAFTKGSVLAFVGYCLLLFGTLLVGLMLLLKTRGGRTALGFLAFLVLVTGVIFVWCTKLNFTYMNGINVGSTVSGLELKSIDYGIGSLIGAIAGTASPVALVVAIAIDKDEVK